MTQWLSKSEQDAWRSWLDASRLLISELNRELMQAHGLSAADYEILVQLSENPDQRIRMSELADRTFSSRSRLSHQIDRMEKAGFVQREACSVDARGLWAVLTPRGLAKSWRRLPTTWPACANTWWISCQRRISPNWGNPAKPWFSISTQAGSAPFHRSNSRF